MCDKFKVIRSCGTLLPKKKKSMVCGQENIKVVFAPINQVSDKNYILVNCPASLPKLC